MITQAWRVGSSGGFKSISDWVGHLASTKGPDEVLTDLLALNDDQKVTTEPRGVGCLNQSALIMGSGEDHGQKKYRRSLCKLVRRAVEDGKVVQKVFSIEHVALDDGFPCQATHGCFLFSAVLEKGSNGSAFGFDGIALLDGEPTIE